MNRNIEYIVNFVSRLTREAEEREPWNKVVLRETVSRTTRHETYL